MNTAHPLTFALRKTDTTMIEHSRLLELLDYCPVTGVFTRRVAIGRNSKIGDIAGGLVNGYVELSVGGVTYMAHRLAWFYMTKMWPTSNIDHIDLNKANNAFKNLRLATQSQNLANTFLYPKSSTGFKGVTSHGKRFKAAITVNRKRYHLGIFQTSELAASAYDTAAIKFFGEFSKTNKSLGLLP